MYNVSKIYTLYFVSESIFAWMKVLYMLCSSTSIPAKRETVDAKRGVIRRNTIATIIRVKQIYNDLITTLRRKQNSEQYEPYRKLTVNSGAPEL